MRTIFNDVGESDAADLEWIFVDDDNSTRRRLSRRRTANTIFLLVVVRAEGASSRLIFRGFLLSPDSGEGGLDLLHHASDQFVIGSDKRPLYFDFCDDGLLGVGEGGFSIFRGEV